MQQISAFMEQTSFSAISEMTSNANLQPNKSTSKAIFNPKKLLWKTVSFYGQTRALWAYCSQVPTFIEPVNLSSTFGMTYNTYFQTLENTSKAPLQPNVSTTKNIKGDFCYEKIN